MGRLVPFINFTLQNFEVFLHVEKRLLVKRGLFEGATVRDATYTLSAPNSNYMELLCDHMLGVIAETEAVVG